MKVYCFYLIDNRTDFSKKYPGVSSDKVYHSDNNAMALYAFTPNKKFAKHFRKTRNMTIFREYIIHDMTNEDYDEFYTQNEDSILGYHDFKTSTNKEGTLDSMDIRLIVTNKESECSILLSGSVFYRILDNCGHAFELSLEYYTEKVRYIMETRLYFNDIMEFTNVNDLMSFTPLNIDMLAIYCYLFSNTYK